MTEPRTYVDLNGIVQSAPHADDREAGIAALPCPHDTVDTFYGPKGSDVPPIWACAACKRRFYPACPECVSVGHRGDPDLAHKVRDAIPAEPLDVERLTAALNNLEIPERWVARERDKLAERIAREYAALPDAILPGDDDPEWPGYCMKCGKGMVPRDHDCNTILPGEPEGEGAS